MDTGRGSFERFDDTTEIEGLREKHPNSKGIFRVGEVLYLRGSRFRVKGISPFGIKLKLLKDLDGASVIGTRLRGPNEDSRD